jgi:hypothetical protein
MTDSPIQDAITHLRAVIKETQDEGKEPHIGVFRAMHALSYAVTAMQDPQEALDVVRENARRLAEAKAADAKAEPLREALERIAAINPNYPIGNPPDPQYFIRTAQNIAGSALCLAAPPAVDRAAGPITTEQLDQLQFGRSLHERPVDRAAVIEECAKIAESSCVSYNGTRIGIGIATKIRDLKQ